MPSEPVRKLIHLTGFGKYNYHISLIGVSGFFQESPDIFFDIYHKINNLIVNKFVLFKF